jgi:hypothetical protein
MYGRMITKIEKKNTDDELPIYIFLAFIIKIISKKYTKSIFVYSIVDLSLLQTKLKEI